MNRQRKVVITVTYNDLGTIVDTKAEELDLSAQPNLQPTCNNLATDTIDRQAAIDIAKDLLIQMEEYHQYNQAINNYCTELVKLPPAQPEIIRCKDCKYCEHWYADKGRCFLWHEDGIDVFEDGFCNYVERRTDG